MSQLSCLIILKKRIYSRKNKTKNGGKKAKRGKQHTQKKNPVGLYGLRKAEMGVYNDGVLRSSEVEM